MNVKRYIKDNGSTICIILSLLLFFFSLLVNTSSSDTDQVAARLEKNIGKRMAILDGYVEKAMESDHSKWLQMDDLPEDMVIYRYIYDTLQSWCNQFTTYNDDISSRLVFQKLGNQKMNLSSPLSKVTGQVKYMNLGPEWYLVKSVTDGIGCKIIAGIEIKNILIEDLHKAYNGVNEYLKLSGKFSILPLSSSGGSPVYFEGVPLFKVISETSQNSPFLANSILRWISLLLMTLASVLYLWTHKSVHIYLINIVLLMLAAAIAYIWGLQMQEVSNMFSPTIYADGQSLYSLGALMIMNIAVILFIVCTYLIKDKFIDTIARSPRKHLFIVYGTGLTLLAAAVATYTGLTFKSLIMNSNISLEMYFWNQLSLFSIIVYAIYICLFLSILLIVQMCEPVLHRYFGIKYNVFHTRSLMIFALICATYFTVASGILGFRKEQNRMMVVANRIAIDRDLSLEIQLRNTEDAIANDQFISTLSAMERSEIIILHRLTENYLNRVTQNYDITISVCGLNDTECLKKYENTIFTGIPIADNSRFIHAYDINDNSRYIGVFMYYSPEHGISRMILDIEPKANREDRGYYNILGKYSKSGKADIPNNYSYAKYVSGKLVSDKGTYAYPTVLYRTIKESVDNGEETIRTKGYIHFINRINSDEIIIISRKIRSVATYMVTFSYLIFIIFAVLAAFTWKKSPNKVLKRNYYRSRINIILFISLFMTLVIMTGMSVAFVYKRNETNMNNMMSSKINTIQNLIENQCRYISATSELNTQDFSYILENIGNDTKSDITLYTPEGKVFRSTTPEIFDKMILGSRINEEAYYNIKYRNQRFYINPEQIGKDRYFSLYAPVMNAEGKMIAIIGTPYTEQNYDFKTDILFHTATIINLFLILLSAALFVTMTVVNNMFKPLIEMGQKMSTADIHGLEYIIYRRDDEISTLVDAYNRMVHDLSESTKKITQAERDMAWSEMARQVAHEIKNPLTPIKLEIQRLIRLKQKNDPSWETKFDRVSNIVLEHIDILTDTANEFSTFAKLYTEEPVLMNLDQTLHDQITIFDNKDNIKISYIGLNGASVMAPRPQLIRVFVNLLTNAIQAVEIQQKEALEQGLEPEKGKIFICLRNSTKDGYYDIVFEDSGPGVSEDHQSRLFTPNFTTKTGGTGLGLAICRNIIEKCDGEILYQRSFALRGACFTVRLPKLK